jgi:phosphatidylethanolamine/phosphatidyl-N-methylethanolamine N-methyltransferase
MPALDSDAPIDNNVTNKMTAILQTMAENPPFTREDAMQIGQAIKEGELFFKEWLRSPKAVGSIIPSSSVLARAIAEEIAWKPGQFIVELGGGTGSISQGLLDAGIPREKLMIIEYADDLYEYLQHHFPGCRVIKGDATKLGDILEEQGVDDVGTVVSGVPMVGNPKAFRKAVVNAAFSVLPRQGFMLQYSYSLICPVPKRELSIDASIARYVLRNIPPASVWKYERKT